MGTVLVPVRRRILMGAFIAGLALALGVPTIALAANSASWTTRRPVAGSSTYAARPSLSVRVYDSHGMHDSTAYRFYLDGQLISATPTYLVKGGWNPKRPDRRRVRFSAVPPSDLAPGVHRVTVKMRDKKHKWFKKSWTFTVKTTTTFGGPTPAPGSTAYDTPAISLNVSSVNGAAPDGISMTIDGETVARTLSPAGGGTSFSVTASASSLDLGAHTVVVAVRDTGGYTRTYSWTFTVAEPPLLDMPNSASMSDCAGCHADYPEAHPMGFCNGCHGTMAPPRVDGSKMKTYPQGSLSAHGTTCPHCHQGQASPHTLDSDCTRCHSDDYPILPQAHAQEITTYHDSDNVFCVRSGCHNASLTIEHYRHTTAGGAALTCATCHKSTDPEVRSTIDDQSAECTGCHGSSEEHPNTDIEHAVAAGECTVAGCHVGQAETIHNGKCAACHAPGKTASTTNCLTCHDPHEHDASPANAVITINGTGYGLHACIECHASMDLAVIHGPTSSCDKCHAGSDPAATAKPWNGGCVQGECHKTSTDLAMHGAINSGHLAGTTPTCSEPHCHEGGTSGKDVAKLHEDTDDGCQTCHTAGRALTTQCSASGCHSNADTHPVSDPHPRMREGHTEDLLSSCVTSQCHVEADLATIHTKERRPPKVAPDCEPCHGVDGVGGTLTKGCQNSACHYQSIPIIHAGADAKHAVTGLCATPCHIGNLADIHGETNCALCHNETMDLTALPSTACENCHTPYDLPALHASAAATHTAVNESCAMPECHTEAEIDADNVAVIHGDASGQGCVACHGPDSLKIDGKPTLLCGVAGGCHEGDKYTVHEAADASHTIDPADRTTCVAEACHPSSVMRAHENGPDCAACHAAGVEPQNACDASTCHRTLDGSRFKTLPELHVDGQTAHNSDSRRCTPAGCHAFNASFLHQDTPSNCAACHVPGEAPSLVCAECHLGLDPPGPRAAHAAAESSHTAAFGTCVTEGCHEQNVTAIHAVVGCEKCHDTGLPATLECATSGCHYTAPVANHTDGTAPHDSPVNGCNKEERCHGRDVSVVHADAEDKCATCHHSDGVHAISCEVEGCHPTGSATLPEHFAKAGDGHQAGQTSCTTTTCHKNGNLERIHIFDAESSARTGCSSCHFANYPASKVCADCHDDEGDIADEPVHASVESSHTAPTGVCVNNYCHFGTDTHSDVAEIHDGSASKCAACHADSKTPTLVCGPPCHEGDPLTWARHDATKHVPQPAEAGTCVSEYCHESDVATIHDDRPDAGCPDCHSGTTTRSRNCSSCHTYTVEVTHEDQVAAHLAASEAATQCVGAECHGDPLDVVAIHTDGPNQPSCPACHGEKIALIALPCGTTGACHAGEGKAKHRSDALLSGAHIASASVDATPGACVASDCHVNRITGVANLESIHWGQCDRCHVAGSTAPKACMSAGCHTGSDVLDDHALAVEVTHTVLASSPSTSCASGLPCHVTDVSKIHVNVDRGNLCGACHDDGDTPSLECADCHTGGFGPDHPPKHASLPSIKLMQPQTGLICMQSGCHPAAVEETHKNLATKYPNTPEMACVCHIASYDKAYLCQTEGCHATFELGNDHLQHVTDAASDFISIRGTNYGSYGCTMCHSDELQELHGAEDGCTKCHDAALIPIAERAMPWNRTCVQGLCHVVGTPAAQHAAIDASHTIAFSPTCAGVGCHGGSANPDLAQLHTSQDGLTYHCDACHGNGKTPKADCASVGCHVITNSPPFSSTNPPPYDNELAHSVMASHTVNLDPGCVRAGCHDADLATLHGVTGGPGCKVCHETYSGAGPFKKLTPACNDALCHGDEDGQALETSSTILHPDYTGPTSLHDATVSCTVTDCHSRNVVKLHTLGTTGPPPGCPACHAANRPDPQTLTCLTTDCHKASSGGGGTFPPGHPAPELLHEVSASGCAGCHGVLIDKIHTDGTTGPPPGCAACHPGIDPYPKPDPAVNTCTTCHGPDHASLHDAKCNGCHDSYPGEDSSHGSAPTIGDGSEPCTNCHNGSSYYLHPETGEGRPCHSWDCDGPTYMEWFNMPVF